MQLIFLMSLFFRSFRHYDRFLDAKEMFSYKLSGIFARFLDFINYFRKFFLFYYNLTVVAHFWHSNILYLPIPMQLFKTVVILNHNFFL